MTVKQLRELGIDYYPDNDGGLFYYDPYENIVKQVKE